MKLSFLFFCMLAFSATASVEGASSRTHGAAAPAPSVDCSSLVMNMAECLSFVSNDSKTTKPEEACCAGLKTVLKTDAECLCEAFKSSAQLGIALNVTKALTLPDACKLHAPAVSNCGLSLPPGAAPEGPAAAPTGNGVDNVQAPAPSPGSSGSHGLSVSIASLLVGVGVGVGVVMAFFSGF